jgi:gliding motility-associated-like protein
MPQLCPNNALAPVFKQDFGQGASSSSTSAVAAGSTNYNFGNVGTDGNYIVTPLFDNANKGDWTKGGDHTGNTNGNMFLVNAGGGKSIFFKQTVTGLCSGSTFNFSAWLANNNTPNTLGICGASYVYPNVIFNIKDTLGNILASVNTGNLPLSPNNGPANWLQYGMQFSLPNGVTSLVLEMVDFYGGAAACGNDLALDDILFTACTPQVTVSLSTSSSICAGTNTTISSSLVNSPFTSPAYQWQKSTNNGVNWSNIGTPGTSASAYALNNVVAADGALYRILVGPNVASLSSSSCVTASNPISLTVYAVPSVAVTSSSLACTGLTLNLTSTASGGITPYQYSWTGPNSFSSVQANPAISNIDLTASGNYQLLLTDANGCTASAQTTVSVKQTPSLSITNNTATLCSGNSVSIQANSSIAGSLYYWTPVVLSGTASGYNTNVSGTLSNTISDIISNNGSVAANIQYQIVTVAPSGCSTSGFSNVLIFPLAKAAMIVSKNISCSPFAVDSTIVKPVIYSSRNSSYEWYINNVLAGTGTYFPGFVLNTDSATIKLKAISLFGCSADSVQSVISVYSTPKPSFTLSDSSGCGPLSITIANTTPQLVSYQYAWDFGNGQFSNMAQPGVVNYPGAVSGNDTSYTITLRAYQYCDTIATTKNITVSNKAKINFTASLQNTCSPLKVLFNNQSTGNQVQYHLTYGDGIDSLVNANNTFLHTYFTGSLINYHPSLLATNACGTDTSIITIAVPSNPLKINLTLSDTLVCGNPFNVTLYNNSDSATGYQWNFGDGSAAQTTLVPGNLTHTYQQAGTYTITNTINGNCSDSIIYRSIKIYPAVHAVADTVTQTNCVGTPVQFQNLSDSSLSFQWNFGDGTVANTAISSHNFVFPGNYIAKLKVWSSHTNITCTDSSQKNIVIVPVAKAAMIVSKNISCSPFAVDSSIIKPVVYTDRNSSYEWYINNVLAGTGTYFPGFVLNTDSATITLKTISLFGCTADSVQSVVNVYPTPKTSFTLSDSTGCGPLSLTITNTTPQLASFQYAWDLGNGQFCNLAQPGVVNYPGSVSGNDTSYTITLKAYQYCDTISFTKHIIVSSKAKIGFTASLQNTCSPLNVIFNNLSTGKQVQYHLNYGDGIDSAVGATGNFLHTYFTGHLINYYPTLLATNACGTDTSILTIAVPANSLTINLTLSDTITCGNPFSLTIYNKSDSAANYQWNFGDGPAALTTLVPGNLTHTYQQAGTYTITNTIHGNCSDSIIYRNIKIYPAVHAIADTVTLTNCIGTPVQFQNLSDSSISFQWNFGDSMVASIANVSHNFVLPGNYTAKLKVWSSHTNITCTDSSQKNIVVVPVAKAAMIISKNVNCSPFAIDSSIIKPVVYSDRNSSYEWYINNVLAGTGNYLPGFVLNADSAAVKLKTISLFGCSSDSVQSVVSVYATPKTSFTISDSAGCGPLAVTIFNTTPQLASYQYAWDLGNGQLSHIAQPGVVNYPGAISGNDTTYTITLKAYQYCDTISVIKHITVSSKAKINFTATLQNTCSPLKVIFNNQSNGNQVQYHLSYGDGIDSTISTVAKYMHTYHSGNPITYLATVKATNGCGTDSLVIPIVTLPSAVKTDLTLKDTAACGNPFTLTLYNKTDSATAYKWDLGDGSAMQTTYAAGNINYTYQKPGIYLITNTIIGSCSDSVVYRKLTVYPAVRAIADTLTQNNCIGTPVQFKNLSDTSLNAQWSFGDGTISNSAATHYFTQPGNYTATLKVWSTHTEITCADSTIQTITIVAKKSGHFILSDTLGKCLPFIVSLTNQTNPGGTTKWSWGDGSGGTGDTVTHTFLSNGSYPITMEAIQSGGCSYTDSSTVHITAPELALQYKGGVYCQLNNSIDFIPTTNFTDSIRWDFGDGVVQTNIPQKISHTYNTPGSFLPKLTLLSGTNCSIPVAAKDTILIDEIKPGFRITAINDCAKTNYQFADTSQSFFAITKRTWTLNQQQQSIAGTENTKLIQQVYTTPGDYQAGLQVQNSIGCNASLDAKFNVLIYQYPQANISAISQACLNSLTEIKSVVNSQDSVIGRYWNLGNGAISTDSVVKVLYSSAGTYTVKLTVATINSCYDSAYKQLSINPVPTLTLAPNKTVCKGDSLELKATGAISYIWKDQNNNIICTNCTTAKVLPKQNMQYNVIGYNQYGCSNIQSTNVRIIEPFKMLLKSSDSMCMGDTKKITVNGASNYTWLPTPGLNSYTTATTYASPLFTTIYKVVGQDNYQCFTDTAAIKIVVGRPTPISIGNDTTVPSGTPIQLNENNVSPDIRSWKWGGVADFSCVYCASPIAKVIMDEALYVTATNQFGCITTDTVHVKTFCSGSEVFVPNAFTPDGDGVNDLLIVQGRGIKLIKSFRIFSRWGEVVFEKNNFLPGDKSSAWDGRIRGKQGSTDVYVYLCEAVCDRGNSFVFKGNVAIIK